MAGKRKMTIPIPALLLLRIGKAFNSLIKIKAENSMKMAT
jgi:hypothetical protein